MMARRPFNPDLAVGAAGPSAGKLDARSVLTVAEVTARVKQAIESAFPPTLHVAGELSNVKRHGSGHLYFTLKDDSSELACVMWRSDAGRMKFAPQDGMEVIVTGGLSVFERSGRYQLYARRIEPRGVGAQELAFRQLCEKLKKEGLFDARHKQPLPAFPQRIAVATSSTGAAVEDICDTLARRFPCAAVYLYPIVVQGPGAPRSIVRAVADLNRRSESLGGIDVLILGRGGGSAEDLAAFNDESVARAIFASHIPVISAVGHETDVTVADLVADMRAATPTAAAELAAPRADDVVDEFAFRANRLTRSLRHLLELRRAGLASVDRRRVFADPRHLVRERGERLALAERRVEAAVRERVHRQARWVQELAVVVQRLAPERFVARQRSRLADASHRLERAWGGRVRRAEQGVARMAERMTRSSPQRVLPLQRTVTGNLVRRLNLAIAKAMSERVERVTAGANRLAALDYRATLQRGYSITRRKRTGKVMRTAAEVRAGERLVTELSDGTLDSRVVDGDQGELFE